MALQDGDHHPAEAAMRIHESRYRELIAQLPIGILMQGPAAEVLVSNAAAQEMLGLTEDQLNAKTSLDADWDVIREDGTSFTGATLPVPQAIANRRPVKNVVMGVFRHATQDRVWLLVNATPQLNADGSVLQVVCVMADITERILSEEAMRLANRKLALAREQLRQLLALNETTLENEKRHIAREVHDELGQVLTALRMNMSLMRIQFGALDPALPGKVRDMKALVDRAMQGVRNVATSLRPMSLDLGLAAALDILCGEFALRTGIQCSFNVTNAVETDDARAVEVYRIVQESLTNINRYAQANHVHVTLVYRGDTLGLEVRDDGKGFTPGDDAESKTFGLLGMHERALALGGRLHIVSAPGQGTVVALTIPLLKETL